MPPEARAPRATNEEVPPMAKLTSTMQETVAALKRGDAALFPTETVYGLGVAVDAAESPRLLFDLK